MVHVWRICEGQGKGSGRSTAIKLLQNKLMHDLLVHVKTGF